MKIDITQVKKIMVTDIFRLDPIAIYLEDAGEGRGKLVIICYDQSWTAYWGAMGKRTITEFILSCDNHYLAKNLTKIPHEIPDEDETKKKALAVILSKRRCREIDTYNARMLYDEVDMYEADELMKDTKLLSKIFGDEWWFEIPDKANPDYEYLIRILIVVKEVLTSVKNNADKLYNVSWSI